MKIFDRYPVTWKELQEFVAQMFIECAFEAEVSKVVTLVRGHKEIDVYAKDNSSELKPIILVECKYWSVPVKQEVIHAFRTVVTTLAQILVISYQKMDFSQVAMRLLRKQISSL